MRRYTANNTGANHVKNPPNNDPVIKYFILKFQSSCFQYGRKSEQQYVGRKNNKDTEIKREFRLTEALACFQQIVSDLHPQ